MIELDIPDFDIEQIALSGQCFRIKKKGDFWEIPAFSRILKLQQKETVKFFCSHDEFENFWRDYFDLDTQYSEIKKMIYATNDPYLIRAVEFGHGIRILKQNLWETIVSYIISQRNNITRISNTIEKLCKGFEGFPTAYDLRNFTETDFTKLGTGYRAKYLYEIVQAKLTGKLDLDQLKKMEYPKAIEYLKKFNGIGDKVANCIALFALHKTEAFPIDVWIQRIIDKYYNGKFDHERFGKYSGIVQQYMFFYERNIQN